MGLGLLIGLILAGAGYAAADLTINRDLLTAGNTLLNFMSVYLLVRASREFRQSVAPTLTKVETQVDQVASQLVWDGATERRGECD